MLFLTRGNFIGIKTDMKQYCMRACMCECLCVCVIYSCTFICQSKNLFCKCYYIIQKILQEFHLQIFTSLFIAAATQTLTCIPRNIIWCILQMWFDAASAMFPPLKFQIWKQKKNAKSDQGNKTDTDDAFHLFASLLLFVHSHTLPLMYLSLLFFFFASSLTVIIIIIMMIIIVITIDHQHQSSQRNENEI